MNNEQVPIKVKGYKNVQRAGDRRYLLFGQVPGQLIDVHDVKGTAIYRPRADEWEVWPDENPTNKSTD